MFGEQLRALTSDMHSERAGARAVLELWAEAFGQHGDELAALVDWLGDRSLESFRSWWCFGRMDETDPVDGDNVHLLTVHAAKGLEFPVVILYGVAERDFGRGDPAEEQRVLYVALTRARDHLVCVHDPAAVQGRARRTELLEAVPLPRW